MGNTFINRWLANSADRAVGPRMEMHAGPAGGNVTSPGTTGESVLDPCALDNLRHLQHEDDPDVLRQVVEAFFDSCPLLLDALRETIDGQESAHAVHIAAHTLKSSCATVGAVELARLCGELEAIDEETERSACRQILDEIDKAYPVVCEALMQECEKDGFPITRS
ncbi:MAG: Hpt domain-containing protein [Gammaproteobacteria bacterium]|nr:Hpt domain-containing protein [Gammaproteobacteria bacterium]